MKSNKQIALEKQRAAYDTLAIPLIAQLCRMHRVTVRDFASIFGISKSHAEEIMNHKKLPSLELAIRIARYWECSTDDLFGWRVDDDGARRPLLIALKGTHRLARLSSQLKIHDSLELIKAMVEALKVDSNAAS